MTVHIGKIHGISTKIGSAWHCTVPVKSPPCQATRTGAKAECRGGEKLNADFVFGNKRRLDPNHELRVELLDTKSQAIGVVHELIR